VISGQQTVDGQSISALIAHRGLQSVESDGFAGNTVISSGGHQVVTGIASGTTIGAGGVQYVDVDGDGFYFSAIGIADDTTILSGGMQLVSGTASGTVIEAGGIQSVCTIGYDRGGFAEDTTVMSGGELILTGGTVSGLIVKSGGIVKVGDNSVLVASSGAHYAGVQVLLGGKVVFAGGTLPGLKVANGGTIGVAANATVSRLTISQGVQLIVSSGGAAKATTALNGGELIVSSGGLTSGSILNDATEIIEKGGKIAGTVTFKTYAELEVAGTSVSFATSGFKATDTINLTGFVSRLPAKLSFVENKAKTYGMLTVTQGTHHASITLFGQYVAAGFHSGMNGIGGTAITYTVPTSASAIVAASHT
jgi:autotransporter passenger strand-loop-strand repeat protein